MREEEEGDGVQVEVEEAWVYWYEHTSIGHHVTEIQFFPNLTGRERGELHHRFPIKHHMAHMYAIV